VSVDLKKVKLNEGQAIVPKLRAAGVISQVFPLHDMPTLGKLQKTWVRALVDYQPLGKFWIAMCSDSFLLSVADLVAC